MRPDDQDPERDQELGRLLEEWSVPPHSEALDTRVQTLFRQHVRPQPLWRRICGASIRVPVPVAAAVLLLIAIAFALPRRGGPAPDLESADAVETTRAARAEMRPARTRPSLAGFEPVQEMNVTVLPEGLTQ